MQKPCDSEPPTSRRSAYADRQLWPGITKLLSAMVALATRHLKKGDRLRFNGLGMLQVRKRPARMGRNPVTGAAIKIKASKKVAFRAAKELRETI